SVHAATTWRLRDGASANSSAATITSETRGSSASASTAAGDFAGARARRTRGGGRAASGAAVWPSTTAFLRGARFFLVSAMAIRTLPSRGLGALAHVRDRRGIILRAEDPGSGHEHVRAGAGDRVDVVDLDPAVDLDLGGPAALVEQAAQLRDLLESARDEFLAAEARV